MKRTLAALAALAALPAIADQVVLYEGPQLRGRQVTLSRSTPNLGYLGFENRAASLYVISGVWEICTEPYYRGQCRTFPPGEQPFLGGQANRVSSARLVNDGLGEGGPSGSWGGGGEAEVAVYDRQGFSGLLRTLRGPTPNFDPLGFNDAIASIAVRRGTWQFCTDAFYRGECVTFGPGRYGQLPGRDDKFSSARPVSGGWGGGGEGGWGGGGNWGGSGGGSIGGDYGSPRIRLFEHGSFAGRSIWLERNTRDFDRIGFNDRAESVIVEGGTWRLCSDARGEGSCRTFRPGQYPVLPGDLRNRISSAFVE